MGSSEHMLIFLNPFYSQTSIKNWQTSRDGLSY